MPIKIVSTAGLLFSLLMLGAIVALSNCTTPIPIPDPPKPPIDNPDAPVVQPTSPQQLCSMLSDFGCTEGADEDCARVIEQNDNNAATVSNLNIPCLSASRNAYEARDCKSVECVPLKTTRPGRCLSTCDNLGSIGCMESKACMNSCVNNLLPIATDADLECLATVRTKAGVTKCAAMTCSP